MKPLAIECHAKVSKSIDPKLTTRLAADELEGFLTEKDLLRLLTFLAKNQHYPPTSHDFLRPILTLVFQQNFDDPNDILQVVSALAKIKPIHIDQLQLTKLLSSAASHLSKLSTRQCTDFISDYESLCGYFKNSGLAKSSFDIVSRFISTLRKLLDSTQLHFHLFLKSISHLSSILVLLDEEKGDYQKLLSELQKFVKVAVDNKKQVESVDEHRQRSKKIYLLHAICTVGGEQKHYKLCAKLRDSLESDREEGVIAGDQLSLLTHAITVLRPLRNIKGDTKGIVQKFNDRKDWHEKAQISYQLAVLVNSENVHKNFASELKGFLKHLIENRASLGFEARNRVLFGLAVIRCQRKSFERLREYLRINLPEFSTPDEEAIFRKACVIGAQTTKQNWGKLESSKQSSHLAMPEIDHLLDLTEQLSSAELFQKIPFEEVSHIARISKSETFSESTTLFSKGDKGDGAYVILKGGGKVLIKGKVIDKLPVGSMVGEMALLDEKTRSASVIVEKGTTVLKIAQKDFDKLRKGNIKISNGLTEQLVRRLRHSHAKNQKLQTLLEGYRRQVSIKRKRRNSVRFAKVKAPSPSLKRIQSVQVIGGKTSSSQSSKKTSLRSPRVVTLRGSMSFLKDSTGSSKRKRRRSTGQKQKKPMKKAYSFSVLSRRKSTPATPRKPSSHLPNSIQAIPEETSS